MEFRSSLGNTQSKDFDKTKYINPNINEILTNNIIKIINNNIDFKLMDFYDYEIIWATGATGATGATL